MLVCCGEYYKLLVFKQHSLLRFGTLKKKKIPQNKWDNSPYTQSARRNLEQQNLERHTLKCHKLITTNTSVTSGVWRRCVGPVPQGWHWLDWESTMPGGKVYHGVTSPPPLAVSPSSFTGLTSLCNRNVSNVCDQQLHGQITRHCYIHAQILPVGKSWTLKMTYPPGNALQNQQPPCRHQPSKFLPPLRP